MKSVSVSEIATQLRGVSYSKSEAQSHPGDQVLPILRANNITDNGLLFGDLVYVPRNRIRTQQLLKNGDVVIAASSGSLDVVGKAAELRTEFAGSFGAFCKVLRPKKEQVDPAYFAHFFRTASYRKRISQMAAGANINNPKNEHLDNLELPLPPLDEQRRIGAILDKADALRQKRKKAIDLLDSLTQSIFLEMFDSSRRHNAMTVALGSISKSVQIGPFGSLLHQADYDDEGIPLVNPMHISNGAIVTSKKNAVNSLKYKELGRYYLKENDVILGRRGEMGRCAVVTSKEDGFICGTGSMFIRPNLEVVTPTFIQAFLSSPSAVKYLESASAGITMANLNKSVVAEMPLTLPSMDAQRRFETIRRSTLSAQSVSRDSLNKIEMFFASLQHRAFSGQL